MPPWKMKQNNLWDEGREDQNYEVRLEPCYIN